MFSSPLVHFAPVQACHGARVSRLHAVLGVGIGGRATAREIACVIPGKSRARTLSTRPAPRPRTAPPPRSAFSDPAQPSIRPFTRAELDRIAARLSPVPTYRPGSFPAHTASYTHTSHRSASASESASAGLAPHRSSSGHGPKEAAVLIPLMNVDGVPHVLLEVRATGMRTHAGELSFPGGRIDPTDTSITHGALREAHEELALDPAHVEVLGALDAPEYSLGNRSRVWAIVTPTRDIAKAQAFIHSRPDRTRQTQISLQHPDPEPNAALESAPAPLPSFPLDTLRPSPSEVSALLPLPLPHLLDPRRRALHLFRIDARRPYWKIGVGDLVPPAQRATSSTHPSGLTEPTPRPDELEVWGLTGWFLNVLAWRLGWMERPPPLADPED